MSFHIFNDPFLVQKPQSDEKPKMATKAQISNSKAAILAIFDPRANLGKSHLRTGLGAVHNCVTSVDREGIPQFI